MSSSAVSKRIPEGCRDLLEAPVLGASLRTCVDDALGAEVARTRCDPLAGGCRWRGLPLPIVIRVETGGHARTYFRDAGVVARAGLATW